MKCREAKKHLGSYVDGTLDKSFENPLKEHLKTCKGCSIEVLELKKYFKAVGSLNEISAPDNFLEKVHERLESEGGFRKAIRALFTPVGIKIPLEAAGVVAVAFAVVFLTRGLPDRKSDQIAFAPLLPETAQVEEIFPEDKITEENDFDSEKARQEYRASDLKKEAEVKAAKPEDGPQEIESGIEPLMIEPKVQPPALEPAIDTEKGMEEAPADIVEKRVEEAIVDRLFEETSGAGVPLETQTEDSGIIEIALLVKTQVAMEPDVAGTSAAEDLDEGVKGKITSEEKMTARVRSAAPEKKDEEPLTMQSDEGQMHAQSLDDAFSLVREIVLETGGEVISVEYEKETNIPLHITVEIPADNYTLFLGRLYRVGEPESIPPSITAQKEDFVMLQIELRPSF
jgi:hypothetical protein